MKIQLDTRRKHSQKIGPSLAVRRILPFYKSNRGRYVHRIRKADNHWSKGKLSHTSLGFWCGGQGFVNKGQLFQEIPNELILCATCEGRAIGAGLEESRTINGKEVKFSPRRA